MMGSTNTNLIRTLTQSAPVSPYGAAKTLPEHIELQFGVVPYKHICDMASGANQ